MRRLVHTIVGLGLVAFGCNHSSSGNNGNPPSEQVSPPNGTFLSATAGSPYSQQFQFIGFDSSSTITAPQGTPAGLTLTQGTLAGGLQATLAGTPTTAGTGALQLRIVDSNNATRFFTFGFSVVVNNAPLAITPTSLPAGITRVQYNQALSVANGVAPFTWSVVTGALPTGLTLSGSTSASNAITGAPTAAGMYSFTIQVTDSSSPVKTGQFPFTVTIN